MTASKLAASITRHRDRDDLSIGDAGAARLSYRAFFAGVDRQAATLRAEVAAGTTVVIDQAKSLDAVTLAVACVLADRSFTFLDTTLPAARKELIVSALAPAACLAARDGQARAGRRVPGPDRPAGGRWEEGGSVVFTSGSTGQPKGVVSSYDALFHYVDSMLDCMGHGPATWLSICPVHFDVFQLDVLVQLSRGANVVLAPHTLLPQQYTNLIKEERVTEVLFISTLLKMIVQTVPAFRSDTLRTVYFGGEGCSVAVLEKALHLFEGVAFCQFYGPTENCNNTTAFHFSTLRPSGTGYMPLGRAIKNVALDIVDEHGKSCAPGEVGEIVISGPQLFSGYLDVATGRYDRRTGAYASNDLGFSDEEGLIWFKGRKDDVVKVNGNRVSLIEINNKIQECVKNATVSTVVRDDKGYQSLVSGIHCPEPFEPEEVMNHLRSCLPSYCVPKRILLLPDEKVTTLTTGKTNYKMINEYIMTVERGHE